MKKLFFVVFVLFMFVPFLFAEDIYTYKDQNGVTCISSTPVPAKYKSKAKRVEGFRELSPEERAQKDENEKKEAAIKKKDEMESDRIKAVTDYYKKQKEDSEERAAESKRRHEESEDALKKAKESARSYRFFHTKMSGPDPLY
jgi:hypothetical protein